MVELKFKEGETVRVIDVAHESDLAFKGEVVRIIDTDDFPQSSAYRYKVVFDGEETWLRECDLEKAVFSIEHCEENIAKWQSMLEEAKKAAEPMKLTEGWYKSKEYRNWLMYFNGEAFVFGFNVDGDWMELDGTYLGDDGEQYPATEAEVEKRLIKEAVSRGFVYGAAYNYPEKPYIETRFIGDKKLKVDFTDSYSIVSYGSSILLSNDGKWATPIEFEYQWLVENTKGTKFVTKSFFTNEEHLMNNLHRSVIKTVIRKIEETKRISK